MGCTCAVPVDKPWKGGEGSCRNCNKIIDAAWTSNDATMREFFDRLEECFPETPAWFSVFRAHCEARELAGRTTFGHGNLARDNPAEGMEEAADGALYAFFDILQSRRYNREQDYALALTAALHFAHAYHALALLHSGEPTPISDQS